MISNLSAAQLIDIFKGAQQNLIINKDYVDSLNVFPVPDGDTGTNMGLTITATAKEISDLKTDNIPEIINTIARGALKGARGNSGVILSQIFKGMSEVIAENKGPLNTKCFAKALKAGSNKAYEAVTHPKEGTMLTVIRIVGESAVKISNRTTDFLEFFEKVIAKGDKALADTPNLLPILAKAGVVDSGGQGLMYIFKGMYNVLAGIPMQEVVEEHPTKIVSPVADFSDEHDLENIQFTYCTEFFIINLKKHVTLSDIDKLRDKLMKIGDCVLVIGDLEFIKVHVHTNHPDKALGYALILGEINLPKIENMREQNKEIQKNKKKVRKPRGLLAISSGDGFKAMFTEFGADKVLEGGQTMNPSVDDIIHMVDEINAENVFVLPNNKNIVLACEQAQSLLNECNLIVIATTNVSQGIAAAMSYDKEAEIEIVEENMRSAASMVSCIQVTHSVKDTEIDGFVLKNGDIIALEKGIIAKGNDLEEVIIEALATKDKDSICTITMYYGEELNEDTAEEIRQKVEEEYEDCDVFAINGGQPHYSFYITVE